MGQNFWERNRLSRRRLLATAGSAGGAASALLIGCGGSSKTGSDTQSGSSTATEQARKGGIYLTTGSWFPDSKRVNQDPYTLYGAVTTYTSPTQAMLVSGDQSDDDPGKWRIMPDVAASWETPDPNTIIFHIDPA